MPVLNNHPEIGTNKFIDGAAPETECIIEDNLMTSGAREWNHLRFQNERLKMGYEAIRDLSYLVKMNDEAWCT